MKGHATIIGEDMVFNSQVPTGWTSIRLGEIFKIEYGKGLPNRSRSLEGTVPVYGSNGRIGFHNSALTEPPTIIIGRKGSIGEVHYCNQSCWPIDTTYYINNFPAEIESMYFYYWLKSMDLARLNRSTAIPGINRDDLYSLDFPIPPLAEQRSIVARIEQLLSRKDMIEESLEKAQQNIHFYIGSILNSAFEGRLSSKWRNQLYFTERIGSATPFGVPMASNNPIVNKIELPDGWHWEDVGHLTSMIGSGITPKGGKSNYLDHGIAFIRSQNVQMMKLDLSDVVYVSEQLNDSMARTRIHFGDVLLNITGASIGRVAWFDQQRIQANVNQHVCILRLKKPIQEWVTYCLASSYGQKQIMALQSGVTREGLNYSQVKQLMLPIPSEDEMKFIVSRIHDSLILSNMLAHSITLSKNYLNSIIQSIFKKAFEGKLISQNTIR